MTTPTSRAAVLCCLSFLALAAVAPLAAADRSLHLTIGDPERREREAPLVLDGVTDTRTGALLTPAELPAKLEGVRLLLVGESHTDVEFHRVQLRVLEALVKSGREVFVGLEMYPYTEQRFLDQWVDGLLTEEGFLELSRWYENWGYHWAYYRDIFLFARDHKVRLFAVNAPRDVVTEVRKKGIAGLSPEARAHIPSDILPSDAEHQALFRSFFEEGDPLHSGLSDDAWNGMYSAQTTWDATMAHNAVRALRDKGGPRTLLVLLAGAGHVAYGVGVARQAAHGWDGRIATLVPVNVAGDKGEAVRSVQASYADFVWGVPPAADPLYPSLGTSTQPAAPGSEGGGLQVILVSEETPAAAAGVQVGDRLLALDGTPLPNKATLNRLMAGKHWGDGARLTIERDGKRQEISVVFRRKAPAGHPAAGPA